MSSTSLTYPELKNGKLIIAGMWLISTCIYLGIHGVVTELEALKYIDEANRYLSTGSFSAPRFYFYSPTIFILAFAIKIKIGMVGAFIIQALINLFAFMLFYKALTRIFQRMITPILIIFYLLAFSPYQSWVVFLYTESIFYSSILILVSVLILYKPHNLKNILLILLALLLTFFSRPLGILFGAGVYLFFFYHAGKKWRILIALSAVLLIFLGFFFINVIFSSIHDWSITQAFEEESIICDLPASQPYQKIALSASGTPIYKLWYYISHNFSHFLKFAGTKLQYFFLMTRDYYSALHNTFLLLNIIPLYLLAAGSFFIKRRYFNRGIIAFLVTTILLYTLTIILQCDDYHNRFILSIYPVFVLLAACTAEQLSFSAFKDNK